MALGRNQPCHCGSGVKYKRCHLDADKAAERDLREALPAMLAQLEQQQRTADRLRREYGIYVNYVTPVEHQGHKVWAIGGRVYPGRRINETFHEFLLSVLAQTIGDDWLEAQDQLPADQQHFLRRCFREYGAWTTANADPAQRQPDGVWAAHANGWVQYLMSVAWDVASLIHASNLPDEIVARLRHPDQYQGARYEIAVAAVFARLDFEIEFLDTVEELRAEQRVEFIARHRPTGATVAVETKSRHRSGVINHPGEQAIDDELEDGDGRALRRLFVRALRKAPDDLPFLVFIDVNAPIDHRAPGADEPAWVNAARGWMARLPQGTPDNPRRFNALFMTNASPHYEGDGLAQPTEWLVFGMLAPRHELAFDLDVLQHALGNYHRVPEFGVDGWLRE